MVASEKSGGVVRKATAGRRRYIPGTGSGTGCPSAPGKVAQTGENDLATLFPELACQWHPIKNGSLTPEQVLPGSHRMVWWICEKGHEWRAQVKSRVVGCGCPVCANREIHPAENDLATQYPRLAVQWHPTKNGAITPIPLRRAPLVRCGGAVKRDMSGRPP